MTRILTKYIAITILAIFSSLSTLHAQEQIDRIGLIEGISNNGVRCIQRDAYGFLWFGTKDGLNRYDGYGFKVLRNQFNVPNSLICNSISVLASDAGSKLWIGTRQGLNVYDQIMEKFNTVSYSDGAKRKNITQVIKDIKIDRSQNALIASEGIGLISCKKGAFSGDLIPLYIKGERIQNYGVQSIGIDRSGRTWAFVQSQGLAELDSKGKKLQIKCSDIKLAYCMRIYENNIFIGTASGVYRYDKESNRFNILQGTANNLVSVFSLDFDKEGNLWIGSKDQGISIYNFKSKVIQHIRSGNKNNQIGNGIVYAIYVDEENRKWIGTSLGGVSIIDPRKNRFQRITYQSGEINGIQANEISGIFQDKYKKVWIGTELSGVTVWDRDRNVFTSFKHNHSDPGSISGNYITNITADANGAVWLCTQSEGINRFDQKTKTFKRYPCINPVTDSESNPAYFLYNDLNRDLWASTLRRGTLLGGLYRFDANNDRFELFDTGLTDLFSLKEDQAGVLWGGTLTQLVKIDRINKHHQFYAINSIVRAIYDDAHGNLWIGTEDAGLLLFDRTKGIITKRFTTEDGLCNNAVLTILDDHLGNLWLSTYNGLSKFNIKNKTFSNLYQGDGLQSNQFQANSALMLSSGEMIFGGINGLSLFSPSSILPVNNFPPLLLTNLKINNAPIDQSANYIASTENAQITALKVPYSQAVFEFGFTALEYSTPNKIKYAYFMQGWDRNWNNNGNARKASYTHIDEGSYLFRVRSTNSEGLWNKKEITLRIIVLPPWYRSWWASLSYLAIIGCFVYVYLWYRSKQINLKYQVQIANISAQREKAVLEKERSEYEKERVIREKETEINEKRLTFFTNISHEFRTPLTLIINPVKDLIDKYSGNTGIPRKDKELNIIYRNARRMLSLVDQLLLFRKAETDTNQLRIRELNIIELCKEVYVCFTQQANVQNIIYQFDAEHGDAEVFGDWDKIEIILFNLLSNAFKYTPPYGSITLKISIELESVLISVEDTGPGVPQDVGNKIFERFYQVSGRDFQSKPGFGIGLFLAKQFALAHYATLDYVSKHQQGSIFTLQLLKGNAHFNGAISLDNMALNNGSILEELLPDDHSESPEVDDENFVLSEIVTDKKSILIVDDEIDIRKYIKNMFLKDYIIYEAGDGIEGFNLALAKIPNLIITDFKMQGMDGIELCEKIKADASISFIPVIMLTASSSSDIKIKSIDGGADDYINKPFEKDYLIARVANLLKNRSNIQKYFYNEITLQKNSIVVSEEYKQFLDNCISVVERNLMSAEFGVKDLAQEVGVSHSNLYKRVKSISGQSVNAFIRYIRLKKSAELFINTDHNVNEVSFQAGFSDAKYFSKQFSKLFKMTPSEFIKRHRKIFNSGLKRE
ncbi:two-component regulator propeller domain-containing protein [Pedobacter frigidisoli]|uniref:two-component regulator propeller domain-containing protein n=1 Tax=Pedobacter frigidisoli TaxID=2530455 RepID=UPI00292DDD4C|nr:two-component regulator propeller domain-containing protein [Pedobacter frigidisoli]